MLAGAVSTYLRRYGVLPGRRAVLLTNNDNAYRAALDLIDAGASVAAIVDLRPEASGLMAEAARARGIEVLANHAIVATSGALRVNGVTVMPLARGGVFGVARPLSCDLLLQSGGWTLSWQGADNGPNDFPGATSIYEGLKAQIDAAGGRAILSPDGTSARY